MINFNETLINGAKKININITDFQCEKFKNYYDLVIDYNKNVNLTAITDETEFIIKHFLDSLSAENLITKNALVCDIGAGAGFPSIPIKIVRDDINFVLFEALNKRVTFLNKAIDELNLQNVTAVHMRAEDAGKNEYRNKFDFVIARAVANINILIEYAIPLLKTNGIFIAYKGSNLDELKNIENSLKKINAKLIDVKSLNLPFSEDKRNLIIIKKIGKTPLKYPRIQSKIKNSVL